MQKRWVTSNLCPAFDSFRKLDSSRPCVRTSRCADDSDWSAAVPVPLTKLEYTVLYSLHHWVSRFGIPRVIVRAYSTTFRSTRWKTFIETLGIIDMRCFITQFPMEESRSYRTLRRLLRAQAQLWAWRLFLFFVALAVNTHLDAYLQNAALFAK